MSFPAIIYGAEKDVYETGSVQLYPLGQVLELPSGARFRYSEMGGTVGVANKLYQAEVPKADWSSQLVSTALAVGDTTIKFTPAAGTALSANDLAGGTVLVEESDDLGHIYQIKSHPAIAGAAEGILTLTDGVTVKVAVAIVAGNVLTALKNPWKDVIIQSSPQTGIIIGIPRIIIAANEFGWIQTRGVVSCLVSGTHTIGDPVCPSNAVDGALSAKRRSGTGTIANAATTVVITHNLGSTQTIDNISIIQAENATNAIDAFWVDTITATQFTINSPDPGVSALDVGWIAEINAAVCGVVIEVAPTGDFGHVYLNL